jgi:hypothetical protein
VGCQFFEPIVVILVQSAFVIVDEHAGSDMHRRTKGQNRFPHIPLSPDVIIAIGRTLGNYGGP